MKEEERHLEDHRYDDIIGHPYPFPTRHAPISMVDRGAQFSPFAALTGFEAAIQETGRLTDTRTDLTESEGELLDRKLQQLRNGGLKASFTYFLPDTKKSGGAYVSISGRIRKIDRLAGWIILEDGSRIPIEDIVQVDDLMQKEAGE